MKHSFKLETDEDLIVLTGCVNGHDILLALDTAASHTVIDFNILLVLGYLPQDTIGKEWVETSNGVISIQKYQLDSFEILDRKLPSFEVMSYDFLEKGITSPYDGIVGLDFFDKTILTIDLINYDVWLH
jgi:Aspartyl protease